MEKVTIKDLFEAGCHFGHQTRRWNPKMKPYVYGNKNGISIIDLNKTMVQLSDACNYLQHVVSEGGRILFVGTKRQARELVKEAAEKTRMYAVTERWLGGLLTNNSTIRKSVERMKEMDAQLEAGTATGMKKRELSVLERNLVKLHRDLDGVKEMRRLPALIVIVDIAHEDIAVREANKLGIPVIAICDTNSNPDLVEYPVAANDDAVRSIQIILDLFVESITTANEIWNKKYEEIRAEEEQKEKERAERGEKEGDKKPARRRPAARKPASEGTEGDKKAAPRKTVARKPVARKPATDAAPAANA